MKEKQDVWQGTLSLMILKTLDVMGTQHGYGLARRIEQTSDAQAREALLVQVARIYDEKLGTPTDAVASYRKVLELDPLNSNGPQIRRVLASSGP